MGTRHTTAPFGSIYERGVRRAWTHETDRPLGVGGGAAQTVMGNVV